MASATPVEPAADQVQAWRELYLLNLRFPPRMAAWIAAEKQIDVHDLEALIVAGATKAQALRILAPL